jgi:hypothetical protein
MRIYAVTATLVMARWLNDPRRTDARGHLQGGDLDIHLVLAPANDPEDRQHRMIVEVPFPRCMANDARWKNRMVAARDAFVEACHSPSGTFHSPHGKEARVRGVGFFDRPHATGHAAEGLELHPVTWFSSPVCNQP